MSEKNDTQDQDKATELSFHPLTEPYNLLSDDDLQPIVDSMLERGYDQNDPVTLYEGKIFDGRNRYRAAVKADVNPVFEEFPGTIEEAREFVVRKNDLRRHDTPEFRRERRKERIAEVGRLKTGRRSFRDIALKLGISKGQVERDWAAYQSSQVEAPDFATQRQVSPPGTPDSATQSKVIGLDGREYPATRSRPAETPPTEPPDFEVETNGTPPDAQPETDQGGNGTPAKKPRSKPEKQEEVYDRLNNQVPSNLRDVFADDAVPQEVARIRQWMEAVNFKSVASAISKRARAYPYIASTTVEQHLEEAYDSLRAAAEYIEQNLPHAICPACEGKGKLDGKQCDSCRTGCGYVPRWRYDELKLEGKA